MNRYILKREETSDQGTFGEIEVQGVRFYTAELPDRGNQSNISCIPAGEYTVEPYLSPKFGQCYKLHDVPDRTDILIHVGNYAGDTSKGYRSDVEGCILLGEQQGNLANQRAVISSKVAFAKFQRLVGDEPFLLEVRNDYAH